MVWSTNISLDSFAPPPVQAFLVLRWWIDRHKIRVLITLRQGRCRRGGFARRSTLASEGGVSGLNPVEMHETW
jgi:hypothetical protein